MNCYCGNSLEYALCCEPFIKGEASPPTAEALMRSRFSAFCLKNMAYIKHTTDPQFQTQIDWKANDSWAEKAEFIKLEILSAKEEGMKGLVEFKATFIQDGETHVHHEVSTFRKRQGLWFYREGKIRA